ARKNTGRLQPTGKHIAKPQPARKNTGRLQPTGKHIAKPQPARKNTGRLQPTGKHIAKPQPAGKNTGGLHLGKHNFNNWHDQHQHQHHDHYYNGIYYTDYEWIYNPVTIVWDWTYIPVALDVLFTNQLEFVANPNSNTVSLI